MFCFELTSLNIMISNPNQNEDVTPAMVLFQQPDVKPKLDIINKLVNTSPEKAQKFFHEDTTKSTVNPHKMAPHIPCLPKLFKGGTTPHLPFGSQMLATSCEMNGQRILVDPSRYQINTLSNPVLDQYLKNMDSCPYETLPQWVSAVPWKISSNPKFIERFRKRLAWAPSSLYKYKLQATQIFQFIKSRDPENLGKKITNPANLKENLLNTDPTAVLEVFLFHKAQKGLAASYIKSFGKALTNMYKFYEIPCSIDQNRLEEIESATSKCWGKKKKPTQAIPSKVLRYLFTFLKLHDELAFNFFVLAFLMALRASEMIKLHKDHITFRNNFEGNPVIEIKIPTTKTHQRTSDDFSLQVYHKLSPCSNEKHIIDPYVIIKKFYDSAHKRDGYIAPFIGNQTERTRALYAWFRTLKIEFPKWLLQTHQLQLDTSLWRYHSLRTTFVGVMRTFGMSWENIKHRTGHSFESKCTRDTYFFNALMSEGFNSEIEQILSQNLDAQKLFYINDADDALHEFLHSDESDHDQFFIQPAKLRTGSIGSPAATAKKRSKRNKKSKIYVTPKLTRSLTQKLSSKPFYKASSRIFSPMKDGFKNSNSSFLSNFKFSKLKTPRKSFSRKAFKSSPRPPIETSFKTPRRRTKDRYEYRGTPTTMLDSPDAYVPPYFVERSPDVRTPPPPPGARLQKAFKPISSTPRPPKKFVSPNTFQSLFPIQKITKNKFFP